jgi:chromosome condensin MukBEF ATPase and DNA-binding subunit MukB
MNDRTRELECVIEDLKQQVRDVEKERDALRSKNHQYEVRLRKILEEPENTMSNGKAMREMLRQARLALGESK